MKNQFKLLFFLFGLLALVIVPAPLLPPHKLAEALERSLGLGWGAAYLLAAIGLQSLFYGSLGVLSALVIDRADTLRGRALQILTVPIMVVGVAIIVRSLKLGRLPHWINAVVPILACLFGAVFGLGWSYRRRTLVAAGSLIAVLVGLWALVGGTSSHLRTATELRLQHMLAVAPELPNGDARFGALLQAAFAPLANRSTNESVVEQTRASILAWGIVVGHQQLSRLVGLDGDSDTVRRAVALSVGTTLRGREDWPRHYAVSAALAVLEHPLISDAGGLLKEQLDAVSGGSGFSFRDLAADRAGVRLAHAATRSENSAIATQVRLQKSYEVDDFFPLLNDLPEDLTTEQFRRQFGSVGAPRYQMEMDKIERLLDGCSAIAF